MRVALFGGSFDPPHVSHVLATVYLRSAGDFDRVLVVPVFRHAFDKSPVPFEHRVRMARIALGWVPGVEVSPIEQQLPPPNYTLHTVEHILAEHPDWSLHLVVGSDVLHETHRWHQFDRLVELAPLYVLGRAGHPHPAAPAAVLPALSSSQVRELLASRDDPAVWDELLRLVPRAVLEYLTLHGLYR